jgi:hypothetical protein
MSQQLNDLYKEIEDTKNKELKSSISFVGKFQELFDKSDDVIVKQKAAWEVWFFRFQLKGNTITSTFSGTYQNGEPFDFPSLKDFKEETYAYLIERLNQTNNPIFKSRYANILWCSPKKHTDYAKIAIDNFLILADDCQAKDKAEPDGHYGLYTEKNLINAFEIAKQTKYRIEDVCAKITKFVLEYDYTSSSSFALRAGLIELMLSNGKYFAGSDFINLDDVILKIASDLISKGNPHGAITLFEYAVKIYNKLRKPSSVWTRKIAESFEKMAEDRKDEGSFVSATFCQDAIKYYKQIDDKEKVMELEVKYQEYRKKSSFQKFEQTIDLSAHIKYCKEIARKIVSNETQAIIAILSNDFHILPSYDNIEKYVNESNKKFVLQSLFPQVIIDEQGNAIKQATTDDEKKYMQIIQAYGQEMQIDKMHLINEIIIQGFHTGKLNSNNIIEHLSKFTWLGKQLSWEIVSGRSKNYSWIPLIAPAIAEYYNFLEYATLGKSKSNGFIVLAIDSLTLKFEGLFRDLCRLCNVPTTKFIKDYQGRNIAQEKDITDLLFETKIQELFNKDEMLFFKFLFIEKAGYHLRHSIAHSLWDYEGYNLNIMNLLLIALFKISKYDLTEKNEKAQ